LAVVTFALTEAVSAKHGLAEMVALVRKTARNRLQLLPDADDAVQAALDRYEAFVAKGKKALA
jgi:hypothetical protein